MATNDVNLQVINSMTQSQMQSLKDANGKIPSLANQIIMTDEEDSNLSQLRTEVVYDMTSSDANKNWGYQGGILGGVTVSDKNFSKYNKLIIHSYNLDNALTLIYDLDYVEPNTQSIAGLSYDNKVVMQLKCSVNSSRTSFTVNDLGYFSGSSYTNRNDNISYFVYKIEGILKQPAMIYTGTELFEGNGISIENGVISSHSICENIWSGNINSASESITLNKNITNFKFLIFYTYDNFGNYNSIIFSVNRFKATTRSQPMGISNSSTSVNRYAEIYYINDTTVGLLTPTNMYLRNIEGVN